MKILVDTCVLIDLLRGNEKIAKLLMEREDFAINSIVYMEIIKGARNKTELHKLKKFLNTFDFVEIDESISAKARHLIDVYHLSHNLEIADALIAATCLVKETKLWTYNKRDKRDFVFIGNLKFFEPVK